MAELVHATAIMVGETGLLFLGPSGSGKSSFALQTLTSAKLGGHFAALVSDDQVFLDAVNGQVRGRTPPHLGGLIELRGSGIGHVAWVQEAQLHHVIMLVESDSSSRIPEENQRWISPGGIELPMFFMDIRVRDPYGWLVALIPDFPVLPAS